MTVDELAAEIFLELDNPDITSADAIKAWLLANVGRLNNLIATDFENVANEISPSDMSDEQKVIFKTLYFIYFYKRMVNSNLGAAAYSAIAEVKEGNRTVRRTNKTEIAKNYRSLVADYNDDLMQQLMAYKMNQCAPEQFVVQNPILTEGTDFYPYSPRDRVITD